MQTTHECEHVKSGACLTCRMPWTPRMDSSKPGKKDWLLLYDKGLLKKYATAAAVLKDLRGHVGSFHHLMLMAPNGVKLSPSVAMGHLVM